MELNKFLARLRRATLRMVGPNPDDQKSIKNGLVDVSLNAKPQSCEEWAEVAMMVLMGASLDGHESKAISDAMQAKLIEFEKVK